MANYIDADVDTEWESAPGLHGLLGGVCVPILKQ